MNQGEIIMAIRLYEREIKVLHERITTVENELLAMKDVISSPIRRQIYAAREKHKQEGDVGEH